MKNFLKNKALFALSVFNLVSFVFFFITFILNYAGSFEVVGYAHILSTLAYLSLILFSFVITNIIILVYVKRQATTDKTYSRIFVATLISLIAVFTIYLIFAIPISIYNIQHANSYGLPYPTMNIITLVMETIRNIVFITYSSILLHKELKLRKLSKSSSPN